MTTNEVEEKQSNILPHYKNKYFEDISYKNPFTEDIIRGMSMDNRQPLWKEQRDVFGGWDERPTWALDTFIVETLFTLLNIYKEKAIIDMSFYKFTININGADVTKTEGEWIDEILALLTISLKADKLEPVSAKQAREAEKQAFQILGEILPTLWW